MVQSKKYMDMADNQSTIDRKMHYYKMALSVYPQNAVVLNKIALILFNQNKYRESIEYFDLAIKNTQSYNAGVLFFNKSLALKALNKYDAAYNFINKAVKSGFIHPDIIEIQTELKDILDEKKRRESEKRKQASYNSISEKQYSKWNPPDITTLINIERSKHWNLYKYRNNLELNDAKKTKILQKLENKEYCCNTCIFHKNNQCSRKNKIFVKKDAICKLFQPDF